MMCSLVWDESESGSGQSDERLFTVITEVISTFRLHSVYIKAFGPSSFLHSQKKCLLCLNNVEELKNSQTSATPSHIDVQDVLNEA